MVLSTEELFYLRKLLCDKRLWGKTKIATFSASSASPTFSTEAEVPVAEVILSEH